MKKLLVLTAIVMLTASTVGCGCGRWFRRGALLPCYSDPCCDPCVTSDPCGSGPCDSCTTPTYGTMPAITPGPDAYVPVPNG